MPKASEVAKLIVAGRSFEDWDTVWVQHRWMDGWPHFRFSCAERAPLPTIWALMQFKPGDPCTIFLGGQLAVTGIILQRQTAYDARSHQVLLSGVGRQWAAVTSSVNSKTGKYEGDLTSIAEKVLGEVGGSLRTVGTVDPKKFDPPLQRHPGEQVFDFLDRAARMRKAHIGSDKDGNTLLIGQHTGTVVQQLVEGRNILKMQCVFSNDQLYSTYKLKGQAPVSEGKSMRSAAEMESTVKGTLGIFRYFESVTEQPVKDIAELIMRNTYEALLREGTLIRAYVTVQGWLRDDQVLWQTGDDVLVDSPMAMLNMVMKIQTATFTQDDRTGTTTMLELVLPWMLEDQQYGVAANPMNPELPKPPAEGTESSNKPAEATPVPGQH